ncbi:MAG: lipid-A-disaccharide synthase [Syntrophobacteraceae bacterium]|nr:lipid-A-disaccharide synthase [Desulfobacteraceae bacterium]
MESNGGKTVKIFISAGEASGDLHGARLARALRSLAPGSRITCLGGPQLEAAGAEVLADNRKLSVVGITEVFRHLKVILDAWKAIRRHLVQDRPDIVVLIDYPEFNIRLARVARRLGIKVFYYIGPQVWAWRGGRVRTLKRLVDEMAVILPFEPAFYERRGMRVHFVGHPLLDVLRDAPSAREAGEKYRALCARAVIGLLPGSRQSEVRALLPLLLDTAEILTKAVPGISFLIPVADALDSCPIEAEVARRGLSARIVSGDTYGAVRACDLVITASGTVTLETAILGTPMIVTYRVSNFTYHSGRHLIKVEYVALPNLVAGRRIVPELLQAEAKPGLIAREALSFLADPRKLEKQREDLAAIRLRLGREGVAERVASMVLKAVEP